MSIKFEDRRLDRIFSEVKEKIPLDETVLLTPSTVYGVIPQSDLPSKPNQVARDDYTVHPAKPGDFVISMSSFLHGFEYCGIAGGISPDYTLLRPNFEKDIGRFLKYSLKSDILVQQLGSFRTGIRQGQRLQWNKIRYVKIPFPDTQHAKNIADFLDVEVARIDQLIKKKKDVISLAIERKTSKTAQLLTKGLSQSADYKESNIQWIGDIPRNWDLMPLRHLVRIRTGGRDTQDRIDDAEYPFFVRSETIERIDTYSLDIEAVLTSGDGAGVGKIFHHYKGKFDFHQRVYAFTNFKYVTARYFYYFLSTFFKYQMTQHSAKSTVDSVRMPFLQSMIFTVPPIEEQEQITSLLDKEFTSQDLLLDKIEQSIEKLKEYRDSLITACVTGQLDIQKWQQRGMTDSRLDKIEKDMEQSKRASA